MKTTSKRLGRCNAQVITLSEGTIYIEYFNAIGFVNEVAIDCDSYDVTMLESYASKIAIIVDDGRKQILYKLIRSNYSRTTQDHFSRYIREYTDYNRPRKCESALTFKFDLEPKRAW